jgi:SCY1-like protein 2
MGFKVDREAVATLVLPQLWTMSIGPCKPHSEPSCAARESDRILRPLSVLNLDQFQRFMLVIRRLSERVEKEHNQFLRDAQRLEDRSATAADGAGGATSFTATVDFESLVGGATVKADTVIDTSSKGWDDDVWGSIFTSGQASFHAESSMGFS